ncbi:MAG: TRAP transporter substrate-binding protein DctP [Thermovirgaceae bacterium]
MKLRNGFKTILLLAAMAIVIFVPAAVANPVVLTYAESGPPAGLGGAFVNIMKEEVEKATGGEVTIEVYWQGSLLKGKEILNGVKNGMVDMGYVLPAYYPKQLFVHNAFTLFPQGPTEFGNIVSAITRCADALPEFGRELEEWNQRVLYMRFMLPMALAATKPVEGISDFKGMKIRASSAAYLKALQSAGVNPVSVPWGDCYMALQTGTIEGVFTNYDGIHATKLYEPAKHIFTARELWVPMPIFVTINNNTWSRFSDEVKSQLLAAQEPIMERFAELYRSEWEQIVAGQKAAGCTIVPASREDIDAFAGLPAWQTLRAEWKSDAADAGIEDPERFLETMRSIISEEIDKETTR